MNPTNIAAWLEAVGGRRFLLSLGCGVACTVLVYLGKIDAATFQNVVIATVAAFIAGNTYQKSRPAQADAGPTA